MSLATVVFGLAVLVSATAVAPVVLAVLVQRESPVALWMRRRVRWIWSAVASLWLLSLAMKLGRGGTFAELDVVVSSLGFLAAVAAAFLQRPNGETHPS